MVHLPPEIFFLKIVNIILIYLLASFTGQNLKKFFQRIQSYDMQFLGPKWPISPNEIFFFFFSENLLMSLVSFIYAHLHAKNPSQIIIY